jgi:hypothetical protein
MLSFAIPLLLAISLQAEAPRRVQAHAPVVLEGTVGRYGWLNPLSGALQNSTVQMLFSPVDLVDADGELLLKGAVLVDMPARDDVMLVQFGALQGKRVRATCEVWVHTLWGYEHAFCSVSSLEPAI